MGLAVGVSVILHDVKAIVGGEATLDAAGTISVTAKFEQTPQFDVAAYDLRENFQSQGWIATYWLFGGLLGVGWYVCNSWVDANVTVEASPVEGKQPSVTSMALKATVQLVSSEAIIRSGAEINRDPIFEATAGRASRSLRRRALFKSL